VDPFIIETITKSVIAKEQIREGSNQSGTGENSGNDVILEKVPMGTLKRADVFWDRHDLGQAGGSDGERTASRGSVGETFKL